MHISLGCYGGGIKTEYITIQECKIPVVADVDVFIAGGGCAGVGAAIASGRSGLRSFLVERLFCLGGMMSAGLMSKIAIAPQNLGLATEIITRLDELQGTNYLASRPEVPIDPEAAKYVLDEMVIKESNVDVRFGTIISDVISIDGEIRAAIIDSIEGKQAVKARFFIDCTGDGQLSFLAGAKPVDDVEYFASSPSLLFRVGNCDFDKLCAFMIANKEIMQPEYVTYKRHLMSPEQWRENINTLKSQNLR